MARTKKEEKKIGNYFIESDEYIFIPSGCTVLDCVLGGGYPMGRISNIIGDSSTNKTGLSIEVMANFRKKFPDGLIWYQDAEASFDVDYAMVIGLPNDERTFVIDDVRGINKTYELMLEATEMASKDDVAGLYVLDTLDGLLPEGEDGELSAGYDAAQRAKLINSLITKINGRVEESNLHLMIVSQIRDNVGGYGPKHTVSGGNALRFYASQRLWLTQKKPLERTIRKIDKVYGILVNAMCKKNKIGLPFRDCNFPVIFNYGIDDMFACLDWLKSVSGGLDEIGVEAKDIKDYAEEITVGKNEEAQKKVREVTIRIWNEVEAGFLPKVSKYS
jgi:recombination protein RecA